MVNTVLPNSLSLQTVWKERSQQRWGMALLSPLGGTDGVILHRYLQPPRPAVAGVLLLCLAKSSGVGVFITKGKGSACP